MMFTLILLAASALSDWCQNTPITCAPPVTVVTAAVTETSLGRLRVTGWGRSDAVTSVTYAKADAFASANRVLTQICAVNGSDYAFGISYSDLDCRRMHDGEPRIYVCRVKAVGLCSLKDDDL